MAAPIDRRLVRSSRAARSHLIAAAILAAFESGLIVAQAALLATVVASAALGGASVARLRDELIALAVVLAARAAVTGVFELSGRLGAARVMSELRGRLVDHLLLRAPGQLPPDARTGELAAGAVQGVDALEAYFAGYLRQLMLASIVPLAVLAWVARVDLVSAGILALTIPILILFMVLIGKGTAAHTRRRMAALSLLSAHFLDVVRGLQTLRAYRRERAQEQVLGEVGERYRRETMGTLRVAFLSALMLELCAMLGTAVVAATIGVELVDGHLTLSAGLTVLLLAPELYGPLRAVGQQFHAGADGVAASERIFAVLAQPVEVEPAAVARRPLPDPRRAPIVFRGVSYEYPGRPGAALDAVDLELAPGETTALVGPSGSGKSTLARLLLRFADPTAGSVALGATDLRNLDLEQWRGQIGWVPQHPTLFAGTVAYNVRLAAPGATAAQLRRALHDAGAWGLVAALPQGLETVIGEGGRRLSAGQAQRIALARAFLRGAPILVLDEPTAHLDEAGAASIGEALGRLAAGRTTLLIVHHESLARLADRVVHMSHGAVVTGPASLELAA